MSPVNPPSAPPPIALTAKDLILDALIEIGAVSPEEELDTSDAAPGLRKLQRLIDQWNARRINVYNVGFQTYQLVANKAPHSIGPSNADFIVAQRPIKIVAANIVLTGVNPTVRAPVAIRDDAWWAANRVRDVATSIPTDLYYSPDVPNGTLNFWPVPNVAQQVELETWTLLTQVATVNDPLALPPAYWDALVYSLAVSLAPSYEKAPSPALLALRAEAMKAIQGNNAGSPRIATREPGQGLTSRTGFNYYSGSLR
jgi:hypothetical protein